jgi:putative ABC transport system permease protein
MRRHLRRTLLTGLTVALASFILTILLAVPASMDKITRDAETTLRLIVNNRTGPWYGLPARYCDQIETMEGVVACVPLTGWPAYYRDARDHVGAFAAGPHITRVNPDYQVTLEQERLFLSYRRGAIVGRLLMEKNHWRLGQNIILQGADASTGRLKLTFVILGEIPNARYPNAFLFQRDYLREAEKAAGIMDGEDAWFLMVRTSNAQSLVRVARQIDETFHNSEFETRSVSEADALANGLSEVGGIRSIIYSLCVVVALTVLTIAANSMAMMVRERISEIAVMRALGFSRSQIAALLLCDGAFIGIFGGLIGPAFAFWLFAGGSNLGPVLNGVGYLIVAPATAVLAFIIALALSLLSVIAPGISALRIAPAMAFREIV